MKKTLIINTGGTIGMRPTARGLVPARGYLAEKMSQMPELSEEPMPAFEILEYDPVIDSANMTPDNWGTIARDIAAHYDRFDGFVVLHGTDTMAYTSSVLPFLLQGLAKPVILTGSQLPLGQVRNDARENLKTAMMLAAGYDIPEVGLFFGDHLWRGCRATKVSAVRLDAFDSPNYPPLVVAESTIEVFYDRLLPRPSPPAPLVVQQIQPAEIATFRLFPGMSVDVLQNLIRRPLKALILESYGLGNGPSNNRQFLSAVSDAVRDGIIIASCTQCRHGCVNQTTYDAGRVLDDAGVISARDMTLEAAIAKLLFLLSQPLATSEVREQFEQNLVGELTPADTEH